MSNLCRDCRTTKPAFDFAWSACLYEGALIDLLHDYKFHHKTSLRYPFVTLLTTFIDKYSLDISQLDYLVPMPLHPTRLRERGYNQSFFLTQALSNHYSIPLRTNILQRRRHTEHQSLLRSKERWTNIDEAFRINAVQDVKNKKIGVVDDLLTTGATASQAARALKENGAKTVGIITLAVTL